MQDLLFKECLMINFEDCIQLELNENEIQEIIKKILSKNFHQRDNLRFRHNNIQFDCLLRGYIGEFALKKWFKSYAIEFEKSNYIDDDNGNIDIDLLYKTQTKDIQLEIKTSLVPDYLEQYAKNDIKERIQSIINHCDIKLIRRNNESFNDLKGDIHLQIYFADYRNKKDNFLCNIELILNGKFKTIDESINFLTHTILNAIKAKTYIYRTFFVAWIDKDTLIKQLNDKTKEEQTWSFSNSKRDFWTCKIKNEAKKPTEIIEYLKSFE